MWGHFILSNLWIKKYAMNANKALFGTILYKDNGDNVTDFDLIIPVTIGYEWGEFKTSLTLRIERTAGH